MIMSFFRNPEDGLGHIESEVKVMVASGRHSFDLAMGTLFTDADIAPIAAEIRATDGKINSIEEEVRRQLIVHTAVQGGSDVGAVLGLLLVVKKLERVGDQAKNILVLAEKGVRLSDADDYDELIAYRNRVSETFARCQEVLDHAVPDTTQLVADGLALMNECEDRVLAYLGSDRPGSYAVPRAMLYRYLKRTVANLVGTVVTTVEGVDRLDEDDLDE